MTEWGKAYHREQRVEIGDVARAIREAVTVEEALSVYAPQYRPRNHRCPCPIHHGEDYNFSFNDHGFRCFVCGASGDVIDLVKAVCELATRGDAMKRINQDMRLNLPLVGEAATAQQSKEMRERKERAEKRRREIEAWNERYETLMDEWAELDKTLRSAVASVEEKAAARGRIAIVEYKLLSMPEEPR